MKGVGLFRSTITWFTDKGMTVANHRRFLLQRPSIESPQACIPAVAAVLCLNPIHCRLYVVAKLSRVQTELRFRLWIGPTSGIEHVRTGGGKHQFAIAVKNFGEIPATNVFAESLVKFDLPSKDIAQEKDNKLDKFVLGPLLPNMEKRYWLFMNSSDVERTKEGGLELFTFIHFTYEYRGGKSGYGMISQFDPKTGLFIHKEMWID